MFRYGCETCGVSCYSIKNLIDHVSGKVHRAALLQANPEEVEQLGRLQYILNNFVNKPILGLEYVQEKRVDESYVYTCQLCNVGLEWQNMVLHVMDTKHSELYITKHHSDYLSFLPDCLDDQQRKTVIFKSAAKIYTRFGRKEIQSAQSEVPEVACPSSEDSKKENEILCSAEDDGDIAAAPPAGEPAEKRRVPPEFVKFFKRQDHILLHCAMCSVTCSSTVALCEHVQGKVHKNNIEINMPDQVNELGRLSYFLNHHMQDAVIVGLEYLVEVNLGTTYKFTCQLCKVDANLLKIIAHVTDLEHVESYIAKHHANLLPNVPKFHWKPYCKALRDAAVTVYEKHGRQEIQVKKMSVEDLPVVGDGKTKQGLGDEGSCLPPSTHSNEDSSHSKPPPNQEIPRGPSSKNMFKQSTVDGPPFTKRGGFPDKDASSFRQPFSKYGGPCFEQRRPRNNQGHVIHLKYLTPIKEFEFNTKRDFLEYLSNFEIDNNNDVVFIRKVTQNCIRALMSFREEEAEKQKLAIEESSHISEAALSYRRRTFRETVAVHDREEADRKKSIYMSHTSRTRKESPDIYLREREPERHMSSYQPNAPLTRKHETSKQTPDISYRERVKERQRSRRRSDSPLANKRRAYKARSDARYEPKAQRQRSSNGRFFEPKAKRQKSSRWSETSRASPSRVDKETLDISIPKQQMERQKSSRSESSSASRTDKEAKRK